MSTSSAHPHDAAFVRVPGAVSLAELLRGLRAHVPQRLLDGAAWERVLRRIGDLPAVAATAVVFEFRLGDPAQAADVFVPVVPGGRLAEHYVRRGDAASSNSPAAALGRYLIDLANPKSPLHRWISGTILEYDLVNIRTHNRPDPGVFMRLRPTPLPRPIGNIAHNSSAKLMAATLAKTVGRAADPAEEAEVERAIDALYPDGEALHIGALPDRTPRAVRLVARGIEERRVAAVLKRLEWPGSIPAVTGQLCALRGRVARFNLSFDVSARGVAPRLGLEIYVDGIGRSESPSGWLATGRSHWRPFIAWMEEEGWCLSAKARGLAHWPAVEIIYTYGRRWRLYRGLNHVKITFEADGTAHAKAYAGMSFVPTA